MTLSLHFFNVGQGDSLGGILPSGGNTFLVDVKDAEIVARYFRNRNYLNFIVITHSDIDHMAGLYDLMENYHFKAGLIYFNPDRGPGAPDSEKYRLIMRHLDVWAKDETAKPAPIHMGTGLDDAGLFKVLHPTYSFLLKMTSLKKWNEASVVIQVRYQGKNILLCGDIEEEGITELISNNKGKLQCDVLKVPHHGSYPGNGTFEKLVEETSPTYAVISAGLGNPYGHPHRESVRCLRSKTIEILHTQDTNDEDITSILVVVGATGLTARCNRCKDPIA